MSWDCIADVNLNRLSESLKLIEYVAGFTLENRTLISKIRSIRQDFLMVKKVLPFSSLIRHRQSQTDIGRAVRFDTAHKRSSQATVLANFARAKESARILEEVCKSTNRKASQRMKKIRFQLYDLEKMFVAYTQRRFNPRFYIILDEKYLHKHKIEKVVPLLIRYGAAMIQLRIKTLTDAQFLRCGLRVRRTIKNKDVKFIVNNRVDIALACNADGIHLGQHDVSVSIARQVMGGHYIIGVSAHTVAQARRAEKAGADYLGVGALFPTSTKEDAHVRGLSVLKSICTVSSLTTMTCSIITTASIPSGIIWPVLTKKASFPTRSSLGRSIVVPNVVSALIAIPSMAAAW